MTLAYYQPDGGVLDRIRRRETAAAYRANTTPTQDLADRIETYQRLYPDMEAGVLLSLAQAGLDPTSASVQQIADMSFEKKRKEGAFDQIGGFFGGVGKIAGTVLSPVGHALDYGMGEFDENITPAVKGAIRTGFVVLETPLQEIQTVIRAGGWAGVRVHDKHGADSAMERLANLANPARWGEWTQEFSSHLGEAGSSSGREVLSAMANGEDVDLGTGFLPAGEVEETVKRKANQLTLKVGDAQFGGPGNQSITTGRVVAARVVEPGSQQYDVLSGLVDGGVAWFGDPATALGSAAKTAQAGARLGRAERAVRSGRGLTGVVEELATKPGFYETVDRSMQSRAAEGLGDLIDSVTGRITGPRNTVSPAMVDGWLTKGGRHVVEKVAETSDFYDLWNATGKKMPVELTKRLADAGTEQEVMDILRPALGTELREAPEFLGFKVRSANRNRVRLLDEMPGAFIDPNDLDEGTEALDRWLRNAKVDPELRKASVEKFVRNPGRDTLVSTMDEIMGDAANDLAERIRPRDAGSAPMRARQLTKLWNRNIEATRAYFVDEIAENRKAAGVVVGGKPLEVQSPFLFTEYLNSLVPLPDAREMRRATSKLGRVVDNPFFERTTGALDALMGTWKRLTLLRGAYTVRVIGEEQIRMAASGLDSSFAHPISFIGALVGNEAATKKWLSGAKRQVDVLGEGFDESTEFANSLNTGWSGWVDEAVYDRHFTTFGRADDGYERAWAQGIGELHNDPVARRVAEGSGNLDDVKRWFFEEQGRKFRKPMVESHPALATREGADRYIDTLWEGVQYRTGSDPTLIEAIATGRIGGARIGKLNDKGRWNLSEELLAHMNDVVGPEAIKGQRLTKAGGVAGLGEVWDNATGWMFSHLNTKPTNYLSRSPTFRQKYWGRIEEMLPYMDDGTRAKALESAEGVVDKAQLKRMRSAAPATNRSINDLADADDLAKAHALDETKDLLYDLTNRGQFFDTFRLLFPFGEAWREVLTRWARIGAENPRVVRRGQQLITGARGSGFFHKDVNGEEVFTYPWSRQISNSLIGMPIDLSGRAAGLSLMTEVLPGVGPVVQIPAAAILPDTPDWDFARQFISPYGEQDYSNGILESFLPGYARNIRQFFQQGDERLFANTVGATMDYLASTGEYDMTDEADVRKLKDEATELARNVYLLRGIVQFGAPTAPQPEFLVKDPDGDLDVARVVLQDFYKMQEQDYDGAVGEFLDRYGKDLFLLTQGKSFSISPKLPVTKESADWERAHADLVNTYDKVWGLFAPQGDSEDFDYQAYTRQFERGDRVSLTPEQRLSLAQARVGRHLYDVAEARLGDDPSTADREWLAAVRERIREEYPGFGQMVPGLPARADTGQVVRQLTLASADPRLADTQQARAARLYIQAREQALAFAREVGVKTLEAQAAEPAREWLRNVGMAIQRKYPGFEEMFDVVFSREVEAA